MLHQGALDFYFADKKLGEILSMETTMSRPEIQGKYIHGSYVINSLGEVTITVLFFKEKYQQFNLLLKMLPTQNIILKNARKRLYEISFSNLEVEQSVFNNETVEVCFKLALSELVALEK